MTDDKIRAALDTLNTSFGQAAKGCTGLRPIDSGGCTDPRCPCGGSRGTRGR
ncbi:hypothetical protein ACWEPC_05185 [Nonomuraea sp. NPDC004297]